MSVLKDIQDAVAGSLEELPFFKQEPSVPFFTDTKGNLEELIAAAIRKSTKLCMRVDIETAPVETQSRILKLKATVTITAIEQAKLNKGGISALQAIEAVAYHLNGWNPCERAAFTGIGAITPIQDPDKVAYSMQAHYACHVPEPVRQNAIN